jgi:hypothetical protein
MHPTITDAYSRARVAELRADAHGRHLSFRSAQPGDRAQLYRLAALDSARPLERPVVVAEVDDTLVAAIGADGEVIADPFVPTASLVQGLRRIRAAFAGA